MILLHRFVSVMRWLLRRDKAEQQLDDELQSYLDASMADKIRDGHSPEEARRLAVLELGGVEQTKEKVRSYRHGALLDEILRDVRYAFRLFRNNPGFAAVVVLTLALGIGANTAIFSLMNAVMLKSLPVQEPERLVEIRLGDRDTFSNPIWEQIRDQHDLFAGAVAYLVRRFDLASGGETRFVDGVQVSGGYFAVLGVKPVIGRLFDETDDQRGCGTDGPRAILSYGFWKSHFGGGTDVLGKSIELDGRTFTIIGVSPPQFFGVRVGKSFDVATALCVSPYLEVRNRFFLRIMGRLKPGAGIVETEQRLRALQPVIREATMPPGTSESRAKEYLAEPLRLLPAATGSSELCREYSGALFVLFAIAGLVLLISCGNIASLLLARATARSREIAVRVSIGASRRQLIRQLLIESIILSLCGAIAGILLAPAATRMLVDSLSTVSTSVFLDSTLDWRVFAFNLAAGLLTGLLFGIVPAVRATQPLARPVRAGRRLVSFQMAMSVVLVFGAALFIQSYWRIITANRGFDSARVLLMEIGASEGDVGIWGKLPESDSNSSPRYSDILDSLRAAPGVESAAYSFTPPVGNGSFHTDVQVDGYQPQGEDDNEVALNVISPHYFETFGTALLAGRDFDIHDTPSAHRLIVNESFARKFMGGSNPVGKTIRLIAPQDKWQPEEVIGLVRDAKYKRLRAPVPPTIYELVSERISPQWVLSVKISGSPPAAGHTVVEAVGKIKKDLPLTLQTFESQIDDSLVQERLLAILSAFFGALALIIAGIGLAGLVSYSVNRRRAEIGIRAALGATAGSLVRLMMRDVAAMTIAGLVAGIVCGVAGSYFLTAMLYEVKYDDPATIGIAALTLALVALVAGYLPARRAALIDPMECLRSQ